MKLKTYSINKQCFDVLSSYEDDRELSKNSIAIIESRDKDDINRILEKLGINQRAICLQSAFPSDKEFIRRGNTVYVKSLDGSLMDKALEILITEGLKSKEFLAGKSDQIKALRRKIISFAKSGEPVYIYGETGAGKNMAAEMLHYYSGKKKPMVYENCANLQSSLKTSRLFGHVKGAFTGAASTRKGLFGMADGTDIFLDEIETLDLETQAQLLDVLDSGYYKAIGSDKKSYSSFRLITASNENIEKLTELGKLRKDLLFRINSLYIEIPPLRAHMEDIPDIIDSYEFEKGIISDRFSDFEILNKMEFPGNVRQLFSYIRNYQLINKSVE